MKSVLTFFLGGGFVQWYMEGMHLKTSQEDPESCHGSRNHKLVKGP